MITEEQANEIIELLERIANNTHDIPSFDAALSSMRDDVDSIRNLLDNKNL